MRKSEFLLLAGAAAGALLALYADTHHTKPVILKQMFIEQ